MNHSVHKFFITLLLAKMMPQIFSEYCEQVPSSSGVQNNCLPGWYSKGLKITSDKYMSYLTCCQNISLPALQTNCKTFAAGSSGKQFICQEGTLLEGICTSKDKNSCSGFNASSYSSFSVTCCEKEDLDVEDLSSCYWSFANEMGLEISCLENELMMGMCGTNSKSDCPGGNYYGVYCCEKPT